jgi:hypothetical protein
MHYAAVVYSKVFLSYSFLFSGLARISSQAGGFPTDKKDNIRMDVKQMGV